MFVVMKIIFAFFSLFSTYSQGARLYQLYSDHCREGIVHELPIGSRYYDYGCCGTEIYKYEPENETSEFVSRCCREKLYQHLNKTTYCCGTDVFVNTSQACHQWGDQGGFAVVPLSPDNIKNGETQTCGRSKDESKCYNPNVSICCSGVLYEKKKKMECCDDLYIDTTIYKCCNEMGVDEETKRWKETWSVIPHDNVFYNWSKCCNGTVIDADKQECCGGVVVDFPKNYSRDDDFFDFFFFDLFDDCCGTQLLTNEETQVCGKDDHLVYRENRAQVLCNGQLHQIDGNDPLNVYCVDGELLKLHASELLCSINGTNVKYDAVKQVCGDNEIIDRTDEDIEKNRTAVCYKSWNMYSAMLFPVLKYTPTSGDSAENVINTN